jgi:hypothetical protein
MGVLARTSLASHAMPMGAGAAGGTLRLMAFALLHPRVAIALAHPLHEHLSGPAGQVPLTLLHFLEKLHHLLVSCLLSIMEILHAGLTAL